MFSDASDLPVGGMESVGITFSFSHLLETPPTSACLTTQWITRECGRAAADNTALTSCLERKNLSAGCELQAEHLIKTTAG